MRKQTSLVLLPAALLGVVYILTVHGQSAEKPKKDLLRVGVYDSRAVAVAYAHSNHWNNILKDKQKELQKAKEKGNDKKVKELEAWGSAHQQKAHLQGFGTAPVHEYLNVIKDKLPDIARQAGVDVIVSKWEFDYKAPDAEVIDITDQLIEPFGPSERVWNIVRDMKDKAPLSEEDILSHED